MSRLLRTRQTTPSETSGKSSGVCESPAESGFPLQEGEAAVVEQMAVPLGQAELAVAAAVVDESKEGDELRPRAVATVHRVRVMAGILAEPLEQPRDRVVPNEHLLARHQPAVLGVQQEHEPHEHGDEPCVDLVWVRGEHFAEEVAIPLIVRRLEAAEQLEESREHLLGKFRGDGVLILSALCEQARQPLAVRQGEETIRAKEHEQGREHRPAGDIRHHGDGKRDVAGALTAGVVDEPQVRAVGEQADRHAGLAEQPLELRLRRGFPVLRIVGNGVEVRGERQFLDEQEPALAVRIGDGEGRLQRLVVIGKDDFECGRTRIFRRHEIAGLPVEQCRVGEQVRERLEGRPRLLLADGDVVEVFQRPSLLGRDVRVDECLALDECRRRHDEPDRLEVAEPVLMGEEFGIFGHGQPVTGQRYTRPTGSIRRAFT